MDFTLDETQEDLRRLARSIFDERATLPRLREVEESDEGIDRDLWAELAKADLLGVALPEEVGGSGHGIMELCVLLEEAGRRVAPIPLMSTIGLGALPIARFGSTDQKKKHLVPVIEGTALLTAALEEPSNRDPLRPSTTATKDGSSWRLDGQKVAVPHAPLADRVVVTARTGENASGLFLLDPQGQGVESTPSRSTHRELQGHITLDGAVVSEDDVIGDPSSGHEELEFLHRHAVACMCATGVGVLEEAVKITAAYISERHQFGKPIATFQGATLLAADAYIDTEATRITTWSAIWLLSQGRPCDEELAIAKFWLADGGQRAVHNCQHLHGGMGVDTDYPVHRYFIWAKQLELMLGGATPQLIKIGSSIVGSD